MSVQPSLAQPLMMAVTGVSAEARDVLLLELRPVEGGDLPPFTPGAHIELKLPNGLIRHYSLINDHRERYRYVVGVGRAAESRGGSDYIHASVRCGAQLPITAVRNNFPLDPTASAYLFIAGGIGITPIMSMIRSCRDDGRPWRLIYAARSRQRAAFYEDLCALAPQQVSFHFDDERGCFLDVAVSLAELAAGEQVYCCAPAPVMSAVAEATADRPAGTAHFEWFIAPADVAAADAPAATFEIELLRSGMTLSVPPEKSILEVVEENGLVVPFSCREGLCRTCETAVSEGEPEHRDYVLSQEEHEANNTMTICVSRAKSKKLVLDL